jgi:hypothetical protein
VHQHDHGLHLATYYIFTCHYDMITYKNCFFPVMHYPNQHDTLSFFSFSFPMTHEPARTWGIASNGSPPPCPGRHPSSLPETSSLSFGLVPILLPPSFLLRVFVFFLVWLLSSVVWQHETALCALSRLCPWSSRLGRVWPTPIHQQEQSTESTAQEKQPELE